MVKNSWFTSSNHSTPYQHFTNQGIIHTTHNHSLLVLKFIKSKLKNPTPTIDAKDAEKPPELPLPIFTPNPKSKKQTLLVGKVRNLKQWLPPKIPQLKIKRKETRLKKHPRWKIILLVARKATQKNPKLKSKTHIKRLLAKPIPKYFTFLHPFDVVGVVETKSVD